jgi:hypothetical protein
MKVFGLLQFIIFYNKKMYHLYLKKKIKIILVIKIMLFLTYKNIKQFMKKITTSILLSLFIAFSFTACSSDSSNDETSAQNSNGDYWPTALDNNWVFTQNGKETNMKIIGIDETNGAKYYKFNQMAGTDASLGTQASAWIKKNNGDYYIKMGEINIDYNGYTGKMTGYEFIILKDYLDINQTWSGTYTNTTTYNIPNFPGIVTNVNYTGKILEKESALTVNGKTFKEVIKFSFTLNASISGQASSKTITNYWIAKNVGVIKMETNGAVSELKSYVIK